MWSSVILLCLYFNLLSAYKIKRTECDIEKGEDTMYCTCGGTGDPFAVIMNRGPNPKLGVPYYGTRFGNNFALQIKEALMKRNRTVEHNSIPLRKVVYHNCLDYPFRLKLDFAEFTAWDPHYKVDLQSLEEIEITNVHSVNLYFYNPLNQGNIKLSFFNILNSSRFNEDDNASVALRGKLDYCSNPCNESDVDGDGKDNCNICNRQFSVAVEFNNVYDILLRELLVPQTSYGTSHFHAHNVSFLRVEGGRYGGLSADLNVDSCLAYKQQTNCSVVFSKGSGLKEEHGVTGIVVGACAVILVFLIVLGAVAATRPKSMLT